MDPWNGKKNVFLNKRENQRQEKMKNMKMMEKTGRDGGRGGRGKEGEEEGRNIPIEGLGVK